MRRSELCNAGRAALQGDHGKRGERARVRRQRLNKLLCLGPPRRIVSGNDGRSVSREAGVEAQRPTPAVFSAVPAFLSGLPRPSMSRSKSEGVPTIGSFEIKESEVASFSA